MMYRRYLILLLCSFLVAGSLAAKSDNERNSRERKKGGNKHWTDSNTMSLGGRPADTIDIDDSPADMLYENSGDGQDDLEDDASGAGYDDEDAEEGSGIMLEKSDCLKLREDLSGRKIVGAYIPECTAEGEFEKRQCRSSSRECWCVDEQGYPIAGTEKILPDMPDCYNHLEDKFEDCWSVRGLLIQRDQFGGYVPQCTVEGQYEQKQCHDFVGACWCVDPNGREIKDTKMTKPKEPKCETIVDAASTKTPRIKAPKTRKPPKSAPSDAPLIPEMEEDDDMSNEINNAPAGSSVEIATMGPGSSNSIDVGAMEHKQNHLVKASPIMNQPGILAAIIGGATVGLLCAVLLVMFIVYRMRKKDEGSYALDEPKRSPSLHTYSRATNREFYA